MDFDPVRVGEHIHGHLGWLAAAALVHPAVLLRPARAARKAHVAVAMGTLLPTLTGALGAWLYGPYRDRIKQGIFLDARWVGFLFERKEHLAFGAILFAWTGGVAYALARFTAERSRPILRTLAHRAFVCAAALAVVVAGLGTVVASFRSF